MELVNELLLAIVTACAPILVAYLVKAIQKFGENAAADTENLKVQGYIDEITKVITQAVSCTSQTYVDALKEKGEFTLEAQKEALQKSIETAKAILSPAALEFINTVYGDFVEYVTPLIEAEVRAQKIYTIPDTAKENEIAESATATVAASTAAVTAATMAQTAIDKLNAAVTKTEL